MTKTDLTNITIKTILLTCLFYLPTIILSQTKKQTLLRDNHIKKILTFTIDNQNDPKYLSRISFVNDSGLIYMSVYLNKKQDTIERSFSEYDSQNREIFHKVVYGPDSICTYSYEYPIDSGVKATNSFFGHESKDFNKAKRKGRRETLYFYTNDKLTQTVLYKRRKHHFKFTSRRKIGGPKKMNGKEFLDYRGNIIKSVSVVRSKNRVTVGGYTIENAQGKVEKDRTKHKTYRHKDVRTRTFKYNEIGFRIEEVYHSSPDYSRPGWYYSGQRYCCYLYEYLKE